ncbi:MAG: hypothetical protein ACYCW6_31190 [Candidatus Xenobia bacterium]
MRKLVFPVLVLATLFGASFLRLDVQRDPSPRQMLVDRPWFDHLPRNRKDTFEYYAFRRGKEGFFDRAESIYRHHIDVIGWEASDDTISIKLLHEGKNGQTSYRIEKLSQPIDRQLDLKLDMQSDPAHGGEPRVYYSSTRTREASVDDIQSFVEGQLDAQ